MSETHPTKHNADALEALLFAYGEPLLRKKICGLLNVSDAELTNLAGSLKQKLGERSSGLVLGETDGRLVLLTSPAHGELLQKLLKNEFSEGLTPAAEETLAIIAYAGPVGRSEIEYIRGVNSSFTVRNLLIRGLVSREADPKRAGSYRYCLSFDALKHLGLSKIEELPEYEKFRQLAEQFRSEQNPGSMV